MDKSIIVGFLAETELHPGAGQGLGAIDQPMQREGGSGLPVVPATSYKGAVRSEFTGGKSDHPLMRLFGKAEEGTESNSGSVSFSDVRLLMLPMRCSETAYKWVTSPYLLERFERDARRAGAEKTPVLSVPAPPSDTLLVTPSGASGPIHIEEFLFKTAALPAASSAIANVLANLLPSDAPYDRLKTRLGQQLVVMNDDDFAWFCEFGLPVRPHNALEPGTKASNNFWYEEYLPADTLMYAVNSPKGSSGKDDLRTYADEIGRRKWLQVGGNETTGEGMCRLHLWYP